MDAFAQIGDPLPLAVNTVVAVGCVRDEILRLPEFLNHHRRIGVGAFYLIDNGSTDGSLEFLRSQPDVSVFETDEPYSESSCGVSWTNQILASYLTGRWVLILDVDELFVYPQYETRSLAELISRLESEGADAMVAPMLDMYAGVPINETQYTAGNSLIESCPYFDADGYDFATAKNGKRVISRGGPRHRLFWQNKGIEYPSPYLTKIPLIQWQERFQLTASTHILEDALLASMTGLLLHFKLLQDFADCAATETERAEHFMGARQYRAYHNVLANEPNLCAQWSGSARYRDSRQLVDLGYMHASEDWLPDALSIDNNSNNGAR